MQNAEREGKKEEKNNRNSYARKWYITVWASIYAHYYVYSLQIEFFFSAHVIIIETTFLFSIGAGNNIK